MKKIVEFVLRLEIDETGVDVQIVGGDILDEPNTPVYDGPLDATVDIGEYVSNIAYHGSEEEWYITYKE